MGKPAARVGDQVSHAPPSLTGAGSPNVLIGGRPAWRGIPASIATPIMSARQTADTAIKAAEATTIGAAGSPAQPGLYAQEQALKSSVAGVNGSLVNSIAAAAGADVHSCSTPLPVPPHGPGVVVDGSPTVLINGAQATRMGDTIAEAVGPPNKILAGCPTVLIGP